MIFSITNKKINPIFKASLIFVLVIIAAYYPVIFLDQQINQSRPIRPDLLGVIEKQFSNITSDPAADFEENAPVTKLATNLILQGQIPLWDPYLAAGQPLAADTNNYVFSPIMLGFFLPASLWDFPLLVALWVAGISTFLFLRTLGLNFISSIAGGIFYMLSGALTWYLPHTSVAVMIFTPLILYSLEKIIQNNNPKYIILTSISISFGILGAQIESLVIQFVFISLFFGYRIIPKIITNNRQKKNHVNTNNDLNALFDTRRILIWAVVAFIGGLGLSGFFLFPVFEFLLNGIISHDSSIGLGYDQPYILITIFIPYFLGVMHTYWNSSISSNLPWNTLWGYTGIFVLFFLILGIFTFLKTKNLYKYTPIFFLSVSIFFIMKTVGVPVVNWIGYLPVFDYVIWTKNAGAIAPMGFVVAASFGINALTTETLKMKIPVLACVSSILVVLLVLMFVIPFLISPDIKFNPTVTTMDARIYLGFQIVQFLSLAIIALVFSIGIIKNKSIVSAIIPLILLEMSLYIPVGLDPLWLTYKSVVILCGMSIITLSALIPDRLYKKFTKSINLRSFLIIGVLITTVAGEILVSAESPHGMMTRHDPFGKDPVTDFLKEHLGNARIFSFDSSLGPNFPSAYDISTMGLMAASNINSFYAFDNNFLQPNKGTNSGYPPWSVYGGDVATAKFFEDKKYFDFLGVKYILTENYNFSSISSSPKYNLPVVFNFHDDVYINENVDAFPRAYLVTQYQVTDSYISAQNVIKDPGFDLRHKVILEENLSPDQGNSLNSSVLNENSNASIVSYTPNKVIIHTISNSDSLLILTDVYYPGWKAFVDGKETPIYRGDGLVRTIFVPSGIHTIEFSYLPQSFIVGSVTSLLTAGLFLGFLIYRRKTKIGKPREA